MDSPAVWPFDAILHAWWVETGRLLAGEYPGSQTAEKAQEKVCRLVDAGVDSIIDLTTVDEGLLPYTAALNAAAKKAGRTVRTLRRPIRDTSVTCQDGFDEIVATLNAELSAGRLVYVHCWAGVGRTGTVIGCWLIDRGLDYKAAVTRIAEMRKGSRKAHFGCPQSAIQHQLLHDRARRRL